MSRALDLQEALNDEQQKMIGYGLAAAAVPVAFAHTADSAPQTTKKRVINMASGKEWIVSEGILQWEGTLADLNKQSKSGATALVLKPSESQPSFWAETPKSMQRFSKDKMTHLINRIELTQVENEMGMSLGVTIPTVASDAKADVSANGAQYQAVIGKFERNNGQAHVLMTADKDVDGLKYFSKFGHIDASNIDAQIQSVNNNPDLVRMPNNHPVADLYAEEFQDKGLPEPIATDFGEVVLPKDFANEAITRITEALDSTLNQFNVHQFQIELHPVGNGKGRRWNSDTLAKLAACTAIGKAFEQTPNTDIDMSFKNKVLEKHNADLQMLTAKELHDTRRISFKVKIFHRPIADFVQ